MIPPARWIAASIRRRSEFACCRRARFDSASRDSIGQSVRSSSSESLIDKLGRGEITSAIHDDQSHDDGEIIQRQQNDAPSRISVKCCEKIRQVFDPHKPIHSDWYALLDQC